MKKIFLFCTVSFLITIPQKIFACGNEYYTPELPLAEGKLNLDEILNSKYDLIYPYWSSMRGDNLYAHWDSLYKVIFNSKNIRSNAKVHWHQIEDALTRKVDFRLLSDFAWYELKLYDNYVNNELRVRDLFTHNAGLGNADWLWVFDYSMDTIIHQMRYMQPAYSYHSSFIYQNLMYMVAGEVIHKISGKPWNEFITQKLFKPLGMNNTFATYKNANGYADRITTHYMFEDSVIKTIPFYDSKTVDAAGGVWSCADDINKWVMFILDSTKINGTKLLKPETYAELFTPQSMVTKEEFYPTQKLTHPHWTTYGLGWFQEDYKGKAVQFHTGSLDGGVAIIGLITDEHFGIYIFANMDHTEIRHALMYKAMDMWVLNDDKNDWSKDFYNMYKALADTAQKKEKEELAKHVRGTHPALALKEYTGRYSNKIFGKTELVLSNDSLVMKFAEGKFSMTLQHFNFDAFRGVYNNWWWGKSFVQFTMDKMGKVSGVLIDDVLYAKDSGK